MQNVDEIIVGNSQNDDLSKYEVANPLEDKVSRENFKKFLHSSKVNEICAALDYLIEDPQSAFESLEVLASLIAKANPVAQLKSLQSLNLALDYRLTEAFLA